MKILSIDVGIKNLAVCILKIQDPISNNAPFLINNICIEKWEVINLCDDEHKCQWALETIQGPTNTRVTLCNKKAFYTKNSEYYCKTHAKKRSAASSYKIPPVEYKTIAKQNVGDILVFVKKNNIVYAKKGRSTTKTMFLEAIESHFANDYFEFIKTTNANNVNLTDIGIYIKKKLDVFLKNEHIDKVIIENQIGRLAIRMKSIQGMITQYFIMNNMINIEFISAANKLKMFVKDKMTYDERKKRSIEITHNLLKTYQPHWLSAFGLSKKKDDLADSLLQGIWYLVKNHKLEITNFANSLE